METIREFFNRKSVEAGYDSFNHCVDCFIDVYDHEGFTRKISEWALEFTRTHVEAALKSASENVSHCTKDEPDYDYEYPVISQQSILNAYSLDQIK